MLLSPFICPLMLPLIPSSLLSSFSFLIICIQFLKAIIGVNICTGECTNNSNSKGIAA